jgi:hypothetical protein
MAANDPATATLTASRLKQRRLIVGYGLAALGAAMFSSKSRMRQCSWR